MIAASKIRQYGSQKGCKGMDMVITHSLDVMRGTRDGHEMAVKAWI